MARQPMSRAEFAAVTLSVSVVLVGLGVLWETRRRARVKPTPLPAVQVTPPTAPGESAQEALITLDGAIDVGREPGDFGSHHLAYELAAEHPAEGVIQRVSSRLEALGWRELKDIWLNPGVRSSHVRGWSQHRDAGASSVRQVHRWDAQWTDEEGAVVNYTFTYSYPADGEPDLKSLQVEASWYPASAVKTLRTAVKNSSL